MPKCNSRLLKKHPTIKGCPKKTIFRNDPKAKISGFKKLPNFGNIWREDKRRQVLFLKWITQMTHLEIANKVDLDRSWVGKILKRWDGKKSFSDTARSGRPSLITKTIERRIKKELKQNPKISSPKLLKTIAPEFGDKDPPTSRTILNCVKKLGFKKKSLKKKAILRQENKQKRFNYALKYLNESWRNSIFIDETEIKLFDDKQKGWIKDGDPAVFHAPRKSPSIKLLCGISEKGTVFMRSFEGGYQQQKICSASCWCKTRDL